MTMFPRNVTCPTCNAGPGIGCRSTKPSRRPCTDHRARLDSPECNARPVTARQAALIARGLRVPGGAL